MEREVYVVGGGTSLEGFDFSVLQNKDTIVVNKSILNVPNSNYFITVDFTFLRKIPICKLQMSDATKIFVACLHFDYIQENAGRIIDIRNGLVYDLSNFDMIIKSRATGDIGYSFKDFKNGLNSGFCGLQLALVLGYTKIYLLGIDMCNSITTQNTHFHGGYGENASKFSVKLDKYFEHFKIALNKIKQETNIEVISLSSISRLNKIIEYADYRKVLQS